ncbi:MAG: hypothetical protein U1F39_04715 [Steroidobacteraceae bacterium]
MLGEPLTEMPRDLYIPPQAMEVFLDAFEGPLDLLLYLDPPAEPEHPRHPHRRDHAPVHAVHRGDDRAATRPRRRILVMAATLAEIKSRMLLPRATTPGARA